MNLESIWRNFKIRQDKVEICLLLEQLLEMGIYCRIFKGKNKHSGVSRLFLRMGTSLEHLMC